MMPTVVILAGGCATRLYPVTRTIAKSMLDIDGEPFIAHQLKLLKRKGVNKVVICAGYLGEQIKKFVGNGKAFGLAVKFSFDGEKLLGTGGAIKQALPLLDDIFFVIYGDSYLNIDFLPIVDYFLAHNKKGLMVVIKNKNKWDKSNIIYKNGNIIKYDKKSYESEMKHIDYGLGIFRRSVFSAIAGKEAFDLAVVYHGLIKNKQLLGFEAKKRPYEIGSSGGLAQTVKYLSNHRKTRENQ